MRKTALAMLVVVALMLAACGTAPTDAPAQTGSAVTAPPPPTDTGTDSGSSDEDETSSDPAPAGDTPAAAVEFDDLAPLGTEVEVGQWQVTLLSINPDAWAELSDVDGIDPPAPGHQYVVARVQVSNNGDGNRTDLGLSRSYIGSDGESYFAGELGQSCADIPEGVNDPATREIPGGATQEMNFCWSVPASVVQGGAIKVTQFVTGEGYVSAMFEGVR